MDLIKNDVVDNIKFSFIKKSPIHCLGLFSTENIKKGTILAILDGQLVNWNDYENIIGKLETDLSNINQFLFI